MKGWKRSLNIKYIREKLANIFEETSIFLFYFKDILGPKVFPFAVYQFLSPSSWEMVGIKCRPGQTCTPAQTQSLDLLAYFKLLEDSSWHKLLIKYIIQFSLYTLWFWLMNWDFFQPFQTLFSLVPLTVLFVISDTSGFLFSCLTSKSQNNPM